MIVYAADRAMEVIGMASTDLQKGLTIFDDIKTEDVETGVASFEFSVHYTQETRALAESMFAVGNYLLRKDGDDEGYFTVTEYESDTKDQLVTVYAEDAGLDLLNDVCAAYTADAAHDIAWYINRYISSTGFEIGRNTFGSSMLQLTFTDEQTAKERLDEIAEKFGAEISYGFEMKELYVAHKYVHIHKSRGSDKGVQLALGRDIDNIHIAKNINELATGLIVVGGTGSNTDIATNLDGYTYDDGDFYVSGKNLYSRKALATWARFLPDARRQATGVSAHIMRVFRSDKVSQAQLCADAIAELKRLREPQVNYEVDIVKLPEDVNLGDTVYVIDDSGGLYLQARILKFETRCADGRKIATLGDYLIKDSGISSTVEGLAKQFSDYIDTVQSTTVFDVLTTYTTTSTILTARVTRGRKDITGQFTATDFSWYKKTESTYELLGTGYTITIDNTTMGYGGTVVCRFTE